VKRAANFSAVSASPMYDANMQHLEFGIDPDIKVNMTSEDMQRNVDTIIEDW